MITTSKQGRSKVKTSSYVNRELYYMQQMNRYVLSLFSNINEVYTQGKITYSITSNYIAIEYINQQGEVLCAVELSCGVDNRLAFDETKYFIQDFLLECFYTYEYRVAHEGSVRLKTLALVMGVDFRTVFYEIDLIEEAIIQGFMQMCALGNTMALQGKLKKSPWLKAMYKHVRASM